MTAVRWRGTGSLRFRLLAATLAAISLALLLAGLLLAGLFREHVLRQFEVSLAEQLDRLTAELAFDDRGQPVVDAQQLSDPRWHRPYSGLYWQIDRLSPDATSRRGVLRSRSLWDSELDLVADALVDGERHVHLGTGPQGQALLIVERSVRSAQAPDVGWRLIVAGDRAQTDQAVRDFNRMLALSLVLLGLLLGLAAWAQVAVGLAPLRALQRAITDLREGHRTRLHGDFPQEVQPLIEDFNAVLERNAEITERARTQAGNLAHALKTPLAVMAQAARDPRDADRLAALVQEQVAMAQRQLDWHLARARAAATQGLPGQRSEVAPLLQGLLRVMDKVHAARALRWSVSPVPEGAAFAGEAQDLQDMLGNLLDNAARWARREVAVAVRQEPGRLVIEIDDDGPGIASDQRDTALRRGGRLDETVPGSGLGLAIVAELSGLYGGAVALGDSPLGGLRATLSLPASVSPR
jgi:signal transduction histidine kinase